MTIYWKQLWICLTCKLYSKCSIRKIFEGNIGKRIFHRTAQSYIALDIGKLSSRQCKCEVKGREID
jgi:hypothetical protein